MDFKRTLRGVSHEVLEVILVVLGVALMVLGMVLVVLGGSRLTFLSSVLLRSHANTRCANTR